MLVAGASVAGMEKVRRWAQTPSSSPYYGVSDVRKADGGGDVQYDNKILRLQHSSHRLCSSRNLGDSMSVMLAYIYSITSPPG